MRRMLIGVVPLTLALVLIGGLWPVDERGGGFDDGLAAVRSPIGLESRTASARIISIPFGLDTPLTVHHNDRQIFYRGQVGCTQGQQFRTTIRITQGDAEGEGQLVQRCTGELEAFEVRVVARGPHTFTVGEPAEVAGWAGTFHRGTMTGEHTWEGETVLRSEGDDQELRID